MGNYIRRAAGVAQAWVCPPIFSRDAMHHESSELLCVGETWPWPKVVNENLAVKVRAQEGLWGF